jgi:tetratricopeptide (TPR) repeat protein
VQLAASATPLLMRLSLLDECRCYGEKALAVLRDEDRGTRSEMILQEAVAYSSMFTRGNSSEVRAALERGLALATAFKETTRQLHFFAGLNAYLYRIGDFRGALAIARRASAVAEEANNSAGLIMAEWMLGIAHHCVGNQADAERHCQNGMTHAVAQTVFNPIFFGYDHRIRALVGLSGALWLRGYPNRALRTAQQAIDEASARDQPVSVCMSLYTAQIFFRAGSVQRARELAERLIEYAPRFALDPFLAIGTALKAEFAIASGDVVTGVASLRKALETLRSEQHNVLYTIFSGALSQGLQKLGRFDEALSTVNVAIDQAVRSGAEFELAELLRLKAEVLASQGECAAAVDVLYESLRVAHDQTALAYQLRSATTLARLLSENGQRRRGRDILSPVYDRFTEGFETPDLQIAYAVLQDFA